MGLNMSDDLDISILSDFSQADLEDLIQTYGSPESDDGEPEVKPADKPVENPLDLSKMDSITNLFNGFDMMNIGSFINHTGENIQHNKTEEVNISEYFENNGLKDRKLTREDTITISLKEPNGEYRAVFATLGDIVDFIYSELKKKEISNG